MACRCFASVNTHSLEAVSARVSKARGGALAVTHWKHVTSERGFDDADSGRGCVKKTRKRHAVREMKVGPSEPACRSRLQTAVSCFSQKLRW